MPKCCTNYVENVKNQSPNPSNKVIRCRATKTSSKIFMSTFLSNRFPVTFKRRYPLLSFIDIFHKQSIFVYREWKMHYFKNCNLYRAGDLKAKTCCYQVIRELLPKLFGRKLKLLLSSSNFTSVTFTAFGKGI